MSDTDSETTNDDPLREAFRRRAQAGLARICATASREALADALASSTDIGMIVRILSEADVVGAAVLSLEPGIDREAAFAARAAVLVERAGGLMGAEEVAAFLRISRQAVEKRRRGNCLIAVSQGRDWRYPRCQFAQSEVLGGIPAFVRRLAGRGPWDVLATLVEDDDALDGRSPLDLLRMGGPERQRVSERVDALVRADWAMGEVPGLGQPRMPDEPGDERTAGDLSAN